MSKKEPPARPPSGPVPTAVSRAHTIPSKTASNKLATAPHPTPASPTKTTREPVPLSRARWVVPLAVVFVVAALAIVTGRLLLDARAAVQEGDAAAARQEIPEAIRRHADAIRLYVPGSPYVRAGLDRLEALAAQAAARNDAATERRALEAARGALLAIRSFGTPFGARLGAIEARLAVRLAAEEEPRVAPGSSADARVRWHQARLLRRPGPSGAATIMTLLGCALWVGAAVAFMRRGLDGDVQLRRGPAMASALVFAAGVVLFAAGLRWA